jgi:hypothetical protein
MCTATVKKSFKNVENPVITCMTSPVASIGDANWATSGQVIAWKNNVFRWH